MTAEFYDGLADTYHALYPDWHAQVIAQATALDRLIATGGATDQIVGGDVVDVACGIGTQLVGLARLGHRLRGSDISRRSVERARRECRAAGVRASLVVADMRALPWPAASADAVVCADNALPHLLRDADVIRVFREMSRVLRPGGTAIITTRDYDEARSVRPTSTPIQVYDRDSTRILSYQLWHWRGRSDVYDLEHFQTVRTQRGEWSTVVRTASYRAYARDELTELAELAGLTRVRWQQPAESGYFQPLLTAST